MQKQVNPINETNDDARVLARRLIRTARFGAIGVLQEDGSPLVTRVLVGTDSIGNPIILISELSEHTKAIAKDNRVSLLLGEPKKGDPVAHPRISLKGRTTIISKESGQYALLRARFTAKHPKSELYIGFADFHIFKIEVSTANLNGGFGKAFQLAPMDFLSKETKVSAIETEIINTLNSQYLGIVTSYGSDNKSNWRLIGIDYDGIELTNGDIVIRKEFKTQMNNNSNLAEAIAFLTDKENLK